MIVSDAIRILKTDVNLNLFEFAFRLSTFSSTKYNNEKSITNDNIYFQNNFWGF